jgi:hypothetical protein
MGGAAGSTRKVGQGKEKAKKTRKERRKGKKGKDTEEEEAEESGTEDDVGWDRSDAERDDDPLADEQEVDELQSSSDDEHQELPFSAKPSMKYQRIVTMGLAGAAVPRKTSLRSRTLSSTVGGPVD